MSKSGPSTTTPAPNHVRKQPGSSHRLHSQGVQAIESALSPTGDPVLGLYLHTVHILLLRSLSRSARFRHIMPHLIGTPALLAQFPGLSQIELAALLGTERATAGVQVAQCIAKGFVRRVISNRDSRRYELFITPKGTKFLQEAVKVIHAHEAQFASALSAAERATLRRLLLKVIAGK